MSRLPAVPSLRPTQSIGTVRLPIGQGRVPAGVALTAAILGTTVLSLVLAIVAG